MGSLKRLRMETLALLCGMAACAGGNESRAVDAAVGGETTPDAQIRIDGPLSPDGRPATPDGASTAPDAASLSFDAPSNKVDASAGLPDARVATPDAAPTGGSGRFSFTWQIKVDGTAATCASAGVATIQLRSSPQAGGAALVTTADCSDSSGVTMDLPVGSYDVSAIALDASDAEIGHVDGAMPFVVKAGVTTPIEKFSFALTVPRGQYGLTWSITEGGTPVECDDVNAQTVEVTAYPADFSPPLVQKFDCEDGAGTSNDIPANDYEFELRLLDSDNKELSLVTPVGQLHIDADITEPLGDFTFALP